MLAGRELRAKIFFMKHTTSILRMIVSCEERINISTFREVQGYVHIVTPLLGGRELKNTSMEPLYVIIGKNFH